MKLLHLSDLHLGKRVLEFSMLEDQRDILSQILALAEAERPDAVLIAGDIYDKPVPGAEAVSLFDDFLYGLVSLGLPVLMISGNHDSAERVAFGGRLMDARGVYVSPVYEGETRPVTLTDAYGPVDFFLLPFFKPAQVRRFFPEEDIASFTDAMRAAVDRMPLCPERRSVLLAHQFVTGSQRCESEELSVGGADSVDAAVFASFDYVALGHLHGPQNAAPNARYCGSPLCYAFSEKDQKKGVTLVTLGEKGSLDVRSVPLVPRHAFREIRGTYLQLTDRRSYEGTAMDDYLHVILTDEQDVPDALARLRILYPNLMRLTYDNRRTRAEGLTSLDEAAEEQSPLALLSAFYEKQNGAPMTEEALRFCAAQIDKLQEETP